MAVNYDALLAAGVNDLPCRYDEDHAIVYALGAGFAQDDADPRELDFVYEGRGLRTVPAMAGTLVDHGFLREFGLDPAAARVAEQKLELYRPLPARADLRIDSRVVAVLDHGREHGVSVLIESEARMARDATVLFNLGSTLIAGGEGGFRGPLATGPLPHTLPEREPDLSCALGDHAAMPFIFRLLGDRNPRYVDETTARAQGFERRPLHPQSAAGTACRAVLKTICDYDFTLIASFDLRFGEPLYPGDELTTEMWQDRNVVSFRAVVRDRNAVIIDNGKCLLAG